MKLGRLGSRGAEIPVLVLEDGVYDLRPVTADIDGAFFAADPVARVTAEFQRGALARIDSPETLRVGAPLARPSAVICVGMNYAAHAAESGAQPPAEPVIFFKHPNSISGPFDDVPIPPGSSRVDWEVELGVVIGARASRVASADVASAHIAGFVTANDLSERHWQLDRSGGQWSKGKSAPNFLPLGPWIVTPDEVDFRSLRMRSAVNGEARQESSTADMVFSVEHLVWELSHYMVLDPGDLILTGTPEGVALSGRFPYLAAGDVVELEIEGLGVQRQRYTSVGELA